CCGSTTPVVASARWWRRSAAGAGADRRRPTPTPPSAAVRGPLRWWRPTRQRPHRAARVSGMTHQVYAFEPPERFVAGTVGPPGGGTFFLRARGGGRRVSVALEKVQGALLAEKLDELLVEAHRRFGIELPPLEEAPTDNEPLDTPLDEEFRV